MAGETLYVVDRIVTNPGCGKKFVDEWRTGYLPNAGRRNLTLDNVLVSPPLWAEDESNVVTITWAVEGTAGWWAMTRSSRGDSALGQWWDAMNPLIAERTRTMAATADDVESLADV
ncbi:hypothetical protein ACIQYZ_20135 [Rhodococcus erythropolis]|jgi:hypothetical protein|uniref:hypothetical protein n=1 Tax=Rhodococcus sp. TaxID=1831 RepID=UPI001A330A99|nr:hypothetical protein [Rhodococcus sp. (in: high G+C Gram-positive bacteria)]MBJ7480553.1 hypothetical protein [Rhodococcus sp. (in: high G+C Gram-positive bacteria)]